ncbi:MAG: phosphoribosyltransferase, partial [Actinomycetota bacterium]
AVLYEKPHSVIKPDYSWQKTDKWINFPWSTLPSVSPNS